MLFVPHTGRDNISSQSIVFIFTAIRKQTLISNQNMNLCNTGSLVFINKSFHISVGHSVEVWSEMKDRTRVLRKNLFIIVELEHKLSL